MCRNFTALLTLALVSLSCISAGCAKDHEKYASWEVLLGGLPTRITVTDAAINGSFYVLKQTHEPLFRMDDGEIINSRLLKSWRRNIQSTEYVFCPDTSLGFDAHNQFSATYFYAYISKITKAFSSDAEISLRSGCAEIRFRESKNSYLKYLALYENAPTIKKTDKVELGLGAFSVDTVSSDTISLVRKKVEPHGYNRIVFHQYKGSTDPNLENHAISDFNNLPAFDIPEWVKREYFHYDSAILRSVNMVINHPDRAIRKAVYNCMDFDALRRAYVPKRSSFYDIKNMFPVGVPGAEPGRPAQNCSSIQPFVGIREPLIFLNLAYDNDKTLAKFMAAFYKRTGIKVNVRKYPDNEVDAAVFNSPRRFNLVVVVIDAVRPDYVAFLDYLVGENSYFDSLPSFLGKQFRKILKEDGGDRGNSLAADLASKLGEEALVLPLYQNVGTFYYPHKIKNMIVGRGFIEYPEVADFRW